MPKFSRGDVVVTRVFERGRMKVRPLLVVQNDNDNAVLTNVVVAMITSTTKRVASRSTQLLVDVSTADGRATGLHHSSAVTCENLYTVETKHCRKIGSFSRGMMLLIDEALKAALALS